MDNKQNLAAIINSFSGQNNTLVLQVAYIDIAGGINQGLLLSQIVYWSDRTKSSDGFFYKTADEWYEEIRLKRSALQTAVTKLEEKNLIVTRLRKVNGAPVKHYKANLKEIEKSIINHFETTDNNGMHEINKWKCTKPTNRNARNQQMEMYETYKSTYTENTNRDYYRDHQQQGGGVELNKDIQELLSVWQELGFGMVTERVTSFLLEQLNDHSKELIKFVIEYAHDNDAKRMNYVKAVLNNAKEKNVKTVEDFKAENKRFKSRKGKEDDYYHSDEAKRALKQSKDKVKRDMQDVKTKVDPDEYLPF